MSHRTVKCYTEQFGVTQNRFGVTQNRFGVIQNKFGVTQSRFGVIQNWFGVTHNRFGIPQNRFGVKQNSLVSNRTTLLPLMSQRTGLLSHKQFGVTHNRFGFTQNSLVSQRICWEYHKTDLVPHRTQFCLEIVNFNAGSDNHGIKLKERNIPLVKRAVIVAIV